MSIGYTKIKTTGEWGIRGRNLKTGDTVEVTKRDGTTKDEIVGRIVTTFNDGIQIAEIQRQPKGGAKKPAIPLPKPNPKRDAMPKPAAVLEAAHANEPETRKCFAVFVPPAIADQFVAMIEQNFGSYPGVEVVDNTGVVVPRPGDQPNVTMTPVEVVDEVHQSLCSVN